MRWLFLVHSLNWICIIKTTKKCYKVKKNYMNLERNHLVLPLPLSSSTAPSSPHSPADDPPDRGFFIRMKSTLTKRGLHVKSSGYKVETSEEIIYQTSKTYLVSCILFYFPACSRDGKITIRPVSRSFAQPGWSHLVSFMAVTLFHTGPLHVTD